MQRRLVFALCTSTALILAAGCGESRAEKLKREIGYMSDGKPKGNPANDIKAIPPHPTRETLRPLLEKIYAGARLPDVLEDPEVTDSDYKMTAGVLAKIKLKPGLSGDALVKAIVHGTAEADAWVPRDGARKSYADQVHKIGTSYKTEKEKIMAAYGDLRLLSAFNNDEVKGVIGSLPADVKGGVDKMAAEYTGKQQEIWDRWMGVKMMARRAVAGDEPFKSVLRDIRRSLGIKEPAPITWDKSHGPRFAAWGKAVNDNNDVFTAMTNLKELKDQELFRSDTHAMWLTEGSDQIPAKAKGAKVDPELGFAVHREDLGGGFQEMIFIFPKKLSGTKLKYAYMRSHVYRHLFSDFQLLATAGGDFEGKIVPDKHDEAYAHCGSQAGLDSFIVGFKSKHAVLSDLSASTKKEDKILDIAHDCVIRRASPDIKVVDPDNEMDVEGSAPGSRLGLFQMLARFENVDVNMENMKKDVPKSGDVLDAEAFLKAHKNTQN
jgi:hypothetical protein